jgi:hypothetical protein
VPPFVEKAFPPAANPVQLREVSYLRNTAEAAQLLLLVTIGGKNACYEPGN